jgi:hypothetical protein
MYIFQSNQQMPYMSVGLPIPGHSVIGLVLLAKPDYHQDYKE